MEIFVPNHCFNGFKILVGRGIGIGQNKFGIKDIEPFILHRAAIKIIHCNDIVVIEIAHKAKAFFIPFHRTFERTKRKFTLRNKRFMSIDSKFNGRAVGANVRCFNKFKIAGHKRKKIGGFREGIVPNSIVARLIILTLFEKIAVR